MSSRSTIMQVPKNLNDTRELHKFLSKLVERIDNAIGNRSSIGTNITPVNGISIVGQFTESEQTSLADRIKILENKVKILESYH